MSTKDLSKDATAATTTGVSGTDGDSEKKETAWGAWPSQVMASAINGKMSAEYFEPPPRSYI